MTEEDEFNVDDDAPSYPQSTKMSNTSYAFHSPASKTPKVFPT
jgi:hypothetical protein